MREPTTNAEVRDLRQTVLDTKTSEIILAITDESRMMVFAARHGFRDVQAALRRILIDILDDRLSGERR